MSDLAASPTPEPSNEVSDDELRSAWIREFPKVVGDVVGILNIPSPWASFVAGYRQGGYRGLNAGRAVRAETSRQKIAESIDATLKRHQIFDLRIVQQLTDDVLGVSRVVDGETP